MKIDFTQVNHTSNADRKTEYNTTTRMTERNIAGGYQLDISGTVMDNAAYGSLKKAKGQGKTWDECMQEASGQNVALQRNYMAVMSNSLSTEDFEELNKEGYKPGTMTVKEAVTVVDQIKVKLLEAGVEVAGYTDTVDANQIEAVTGSKGRTAVIEAGLKRNDMPLTEENISQSRNALEMNEKLTEMSDNETGGLSDGCMKYMIGNEMEPTIENIYLAEHSSTLDGSRQGQGFYQSDSLGYYARKADSIDFKQLQDQMEKVIEASGLEVTKESMENAEWLVEKGVPLNEGTLLALDELKSIKLPAEENMLMNSIADALAKGKPAVSAIVTEKRIHAEIRLAMTTEANRKLMESDFSIDTKEMEKEVENLKQQELEYYQKMAGEGTPEEINTRVNIYLDTTSHIQDIKELPAAVIGTVKDFESISLQQIYDKGTALKTQYEKANESYEALKTEVRADLGDSIKKAFRNVEDILKEMKLSNTEQNQRAVRILGYNQMDITEDSIMQVRKADQAVNRLIEKLTPAATWKLIKDNVNPLNMDVAELTEKLEQESDTSDEKYSEYLFKLEKNQEITEEERTGYIGIYRLFRQIEKTDGAVIGSLCNQGAELSIKNLLSAVRSGKAKGIDFKVSDDFGGIDSILDTDTNLSISTQINMAFHQSNVDYQKNVVKDLLEEMNPAKLKEMMDNGTLSSDITVEQLLDEVRKQSDSKDSTKQYYEEQAAQIRDIMQADSNVTEALLNFDQEVTIDHLSAADELMNRRGYLFRSIGRMFHSKEEKEEWNQDIDTLAEGFSDEETAKKAYEVFSEKMLQSVEREENRSNITYVDLRNLQSLHKQLSLAASLSKEENYEVPIRTKEGITSVNLKIVHGEETGKIEITMRTEELGSIAANLNVKNREIDGYITYNSYEAEEYLEDLKNNLRIRYSEKGYQMSEHLAIMKNRNLDINRQTAMNNDKAEKTSTADLYQAAKILIQTLSA